jgi:hypothetical protein
MHVSHRTEYFPLFFPDGENFNGCSYLYDDGSDDVTVQSMGRSVNYRRVRFSNNTDVVDGNYISPLTFQITIYRCKALVREKSEK